MKFSLPIQENNMLTAEYIKSHFGFDEVGVIIEDKKTYIILALETNIDQDLDEYMVDGKFIQYPGFPKYFIPKVRKFADFIKINFFKNNDDYIEKTDGLEFPIKKYAVKSGIGKQGKNTLVIHPKFRGRLRFKVLETNIKLFKPTGSGNYKKSKNSLCETCAKCIFECPDNALTEYKLIEKRMCTAYKQLDYSTNGISRFDRCNICWKACEKVKKD